MKKISHHSSKSTKLKKGIRNDQFYTKQSTALFLSNLIKQQPWFNKIERIIEPSAGEGSFSEHFVGCLAYDIEPKKQNIYQADFLELKFPADKITLCVGNPPFGRQGSLALKFIKKCCDFSDFIAFILPKSFVKISVQNKIPLTHSLLLQDEIEANNFYLSDGTEYKVPCVFQIWHRLQRIKIILKKDSNYFSWTNKENGELAIRRVGFYAGKTVDGEDYCKTCEESHYYIKSIKMSPLKIKNYLNNIEWSTVSSKVSGPRSLSKGEIIQLFETQVKKNFLS
jgi:hypothetical protein